MSSELSPEVPAKRESPLVPILRWIAVLPAAVGAFFGIQLLLILGSAMTEPRPSDWWLQLINSAASSYCFVYAGAATAPKHQLIVGIVLAILFGIFIVAMTTEGFFIKTTEPLWWLILAGVISLVAASMAVSKLWEQK